MRCYNPAAMSTRIDARPARVMPPDMLIKEKLNSLPAVYGSQARIESDGSLVIPQWRESDGISRIHPHPVKDVEAGIRMADKVLEKQKGIEKKQMQTVLYQTSNLLGKLETGVIFRLHEPQRLALQEVVTEDLASVGLDRKLVRLQVKDLITYWTVKAAGRKDSLGRDNKLISTKAAEAAEKRAKARVSLINEKTIPKYLKIKAGLMLERASSRGVISLANQEINRRFLGNLFMRDPDAKIDKTFGYTLGVTRHLAWLLTLPRVKPYLGPARELSALLMQTADLFASGRREEALIVNYPGDILRANKQLIKVLEDSRQIYTPGQPGLDDQINYF